jgi:hypothetical protein
MFRAARTVLAPSSPLETNESSRFSLIFVVVSQCGSFESPLSNYVQPGDDPVGFSSSPVQILACSHVPGPLDICNVHPASPRMIGCRERYCLL